MGLFKSGSSSSANHTCPMIHPLDETPTDKVYAGYDFYHLNMIISGACAAFSTISILLLMFRHATHLSKPNEQLKILRIAFLIPFTAVLSFVSVVEPAAFVYLKPWTDVLQALALGNFFLLMCEFISPHDTQRDLFFNALSIPQKKANKPPQDGLAWFRKKWVAIFQYSPVSLGLAVATCITEAANIYCESSSKPYFAHLWLQLIHNFSLIIAVLSVLSFYKVLTHELAGHKPLAKLFAFKLMVGLNFLLQIIFWILNDINPSPLAPSSMLNEADVTFGIPALVSCCLMVPFSIFFHYAYDVKPYIISRNPDPEAAQYLHYQGGFLGIRAFTGFLNPSEVLSAMAFTFTLLSKKKSGNSSAGYDSVEGQHQMSRREQRRADKGGGHGRRYEHRQEESQEQAYGEPQYPQQGHMGYDQNHGR